LVAIFRAEVGELDTVRLHLSFSLVGCEADGEVGAGGKLDWKNTDNEKITGSEAVFGEERSGKRRFSASCISVYALKSALSAGVGVHAVSV
jgi:hypothetical protein